jgi:hypothetical protein
MRKLKVFTGSSTDVKGQLVVGAYSRADAVRSCEIFVSCRQCLLPLIVN